MMKPQELVDMLLAAAGGSFQFDCNTALDAVDVVRGVMDDLDALNLILKANKEMLKSETARADKAEKQRDELLRALELIKANRKDAKKGRCDNVFHATAERIADAAITSVKGGA